MYDERTRQLDHQWATYAYAREEGIEYGTAQGIERGRAEGRAEDMRLWEFNKPLLIYYFLRIWKI